MRKKLLLIPLALLLAMSLIACAAPVEVPEEIAQLKAAIADLEDEAAAAEAKAAAAEVEIAELRVPEETWEVTLAYSVWPDWEPFIHVAALLLEKMGYEVTMVDIGGDWPLALEGILAGDIDVVTQASDFSHFHFWNEYRDRLIHLGSTGYGAQAGLAVPPYVEEVNSILDLNEYVDLFDGKIVGIEAGAGLMGQAADSITTYGLNYELIEGSTAAMVADRDAAVARGEPWVGLWWVPFWADVAYPMKFLEDPQLIYGGIDRFYFVTLPEFIDEHPDAAQLLMNLTLRYDDYMDIAGWIATEELTGKESSQRWLDQNETYWTKWFPYPHAFPYE